MGTARAILIVTIGAAALLATAPVAAAVSFDVNTTDDAADANNFDSTCDSDLGTPGQQCTLRAALEQSNQLGGPNTVNVPAGTYTYDDALGQWVVDTDTTIDGAGASSTILRQGLAGRILAVDVGDTLDLRDVTVRDGALAGEGAGIANFGTLILRRSRVVNNQTFPGDGGGIHAAASATRTEILDSVIGTPAEPNIAGSPGSEMDGGKGGGIAVEGGDLVIRRSLVEANEANEDQGSPNLNGGGLFVSGSDQDHVISDSIFRANEGNSGSGGGAVLTDGGLGSLLVERSTFSGNEADTCGGGLFVAVDEGQLVNVTVSGNTGFNSGGGVCAGTTSLSVEHSSIVDNIGPGLSDGIRTIAGATTITASILSQATGEDCAADLGSSISSGGHNLESATSCGFAGTGDQQNADPDLGPLADNGGPTPTHALPPGSIAVDRVTAGCPPPAADQRGAPRPQDGSCDSGAYELARCNGVIVNRVGTAGADQLTGTAASDGFLLLGGTNSASGGGGDDSACGGGGGDSFDGGAGSDTLVGAGGIDRLLGGAGLDLLIGGAAIDTLLGGAGGDRALGGAGNDRLRGQAGNDRLKGQGGRDRLLGGRGRDRLLGGRGRDLLKGGPGRDRLRGGPGRDRQVQ